MQNKNKYRRLGVRFHQTFIPERQYISSLLQYIVSNGQGSDQEISDKTGIPTGKSSGKVPAVIKYCQGMYLIFIGKDKGKRLLKLTDLGQCVLKNDPYLSKALTQWIIHLHLCRRQGGAEIWHLCFGPGYEILGSEFTRDQLEDFLAGFHGRAKRSLIGPMMRTYEDAAALKTAGTLVTEKLSVRRISAPVLPEFGYGYAAFLLSLWENLFPNDQQITVTDLEAETFWGRIHGWNDSQREQALDLIREKGAIDLDKQMRPWVLTRVADSASLWPFLYKDSV